MDAVLKLLVCSECSARLTDPVTVDCGHTVCAQHPACSHCPPPPTHTILPSGVQYYSAVLPQAAQPVTPSGKDIILLRVLDLCARQPEDWQGRLFEDLMCSVCHDVFTDPVTTPCQHTFCRHCLEQRLDLGLTCPTCRSSVPGFSYFFQHPINRIVHDIISIIFPQEQASSSLEAAASQRHPTLETPIFRCNLAFPGLPTYLHIFEPRYRLLIRRCIASPDPLFGMMMHPYEDNLPTPISEKPGEEDPIDYGTVLRIRSVQMFPDGRSMVESTGVFRFKLLDVGQLSNYQVGCVQRIDDISDPDNHPPLSEALLDLCVPVGGAQVDRSPASLPRSGEHPGIQRTAAALHAAPTTAELTARCRSFLNELRHSTAPWVAQKLEGAYGSPPDDAATLSFWIALILPVPDRDKARLLPLRSPRDRLALVLSWINLLEQNVACSSGGGCVVA